MANNVIGINLLSRLLFMFGVFFLLYHLPIIFPFSFQPRAKMSFNKMI